MINPSHKKKRKMEDVRRHYITKKHAAYNQKNDNVIHFHLRAILINSMEIRHDQKICTRMIFITLIQLINNALK